MEATALRIEAAGKEAIGKIREALANAGLEKMCYATRARVKSETKLIEKVGRKQKQKPEYTIESITDVIGVRLVTLFKSDLPFVLDKVLSLISHKISLRPHPIHQHSLKEAIVYSTEPDFSPLTLQLKDTFSRHEVKEKWERSEEGYSSVHIVCHVAPDMVDCSKISTNYYLPIEIQIRTVFEDAWGEIDHRYGYMRRAGKEEDTNSPAATIDSSIWTSMSQHLQVLKQFTDACASYADTIKNMSVPTASMAAKDGRVMSVESDGDVLARFRQLGISEHLIDLYVQGREKRDNCALQREDRASCYLEAAEFFRLVGEEAKNATLVNDKKGLFRYYARMNEAFCHLSSGLGPNVKYAEETYIGLLNDYQDFPLILCRLGQAYGAQGKTDDAVRVYETALNTTEEIAKRSSSAHMWEDNLPKPDYDYIIGTLPKLLGFQYWVKANGFDSEGNRPDADTRARFLGLAFDFTKRAFDHKKGDPGLQNNLAYYAVEYLDLKRDDERSTTYLTELPALLESVESACKGSEGLPPVRWLDTLATAYEALGDIDKAREFAEVIAHNPEVTHDLNAQSAVVVLERALRLCTAKKT